MRQSLLTRRLRASPPVPGPRGPVPWAVSCVALAVVLLAAGSGGWGQDPAAPVAWAQEGIVAEWGGDLVGAGGSVLADDEVEGDVMVAGGGVRFTGAAGGDYLGVGGHHVVGGEVGGNVRVAAGEVDVTSQVGRNATLAGGTVRVGEDAGFGGNGYLAGGRVEVVGEVDGHLRAAGGEVIVDGVVAGDLNVEAGDLRVGPGARVGGDLHHRVERERVDVDPAAEIEGQVVPLEPRAPAVPVGWWGVRALWGLGFLLAGVVLVAAFSGTALAAAGALEGRPGASAGLGLLWLVGIPVVAGVVLLTLVGIPLALVLLGTFLVLAYVARMVPAVWIGQRILRVEEPGRGNAVGGFLLGGAILVLVGLIPLLGPLVVLVATLVGVGALLLALARPGAGPPGAAHEPPAGSGGRGA